MDAIRQDVRYAVRTLLKAKGFSAAVLSTLIITVGAATAMFTIVNAVLVRPLQVHEPDRLMVMMERIRGGAQISVSWPSFADWRERLTLFEGVAAYRPAIYAIIDPVAPERIAGRQITWNYFRVLGRVPALGRDLTADDDRPGARGVVLLSDGYFRRRFGGDSSVIGRELRLGSLTRTVVGVMPPGGLETEDVFEPIGLYLTTGAAVLDRGNHTGLVAIGRLRPGVAEPAARDELAAVAGVLEREHPNTNSGISAQLQSLSTSVVGEYRQMLWALFGAVGFLLLLGCANIANLLIARGASRQHELAVRAAIGCGRLRLVRQLMIESALLSLAGAVLGLAAAGVLLDAVLALVPRTLPRLGEIRLDPMSGAFAVLSALAAAALFGMIPAWQASRARAQHAIVRSSRTTAAQGGQRLRRGVMMVEAALAMLLLCGAGLMTRTLQELMQVDLGFNAEGLLTARVTTSGQGFDNARIATFGAQLLEGLRAIPGVQSAALTLSLPIAGSNWGSVFIVGDKPVPARAELPSAAFTPVSEGFFATLSMSLARGRVFTPADRAGAPHVAVINETAARRLWPGEDPLGKSLKQGWPEWETPWWEVVGVVKDIKINGITADVPMHVYLPFAQSPVSNPAIVVRANDPLTVVRPVEQAVRRLSATMPVYDVRPMQSLIGDNVARQRASMVVLSVFAVIALVLAGVGLYGVMAHSVTQRTSEVGVRMALGATRGDIAAMFLRSGMVTAVAGLLVGVAAALAMSSFLEGLLYGVKPNDPLTLVAAAGALLVVALAACYLPSRRAVRIDPSAALRE